MTDVNPEMKTVCQFERSRQEANKSGLVTAVSDTAIHLAFADEKSLRFNSVDSYTAFITGWMESKAYHESLIKEAA